MALERKKTEHAGAKNGDKRGRRVAVKAASRKHRRVNDRRAARDGQDRHR